MSPRRRRSGCRTRSRARSRGFSARSCPGAREAIEVAGEVAELVADELGKAFRPERVLFVAALPKTRSAKIMRRAVRAKALGRDPGDLSSLENPETLEEIADVV